MGVTYFITGTDTGVGKTYIAAKLLESMSRKIGTLGYIKPFQTGCLTDSGGRLTVPDVDEVKATLGEKVECHVLYRYELPACPLHAARMAGEKIDFDKAIEWTKGLAGEYEASVVEGAGGLLVPLTLEKTILDFAAALGYPIILVAENRLGCINHSLLSINVLKQRKLNIRALVLNDTQPKKKTEVDEANAEMIRIFTPDIQIAKVGYGERFAL